MNSFIKHMNISCCLNISATLRCRTFPCLKDLVKYSTMEAVQPIQTVEGSDKKPEEVEIVRTKKETRYAGRKFRRNWEDKRQEIEGVTEKKLCEEPFERIKRKKVAMLMGYSGVEYFGMQRNPNMRTIEEELCKALFRINYINSEAFCQMQTIQFQRAARTDKGVSAARQVVSLKLVEHATTEDINKELPESIRVFDIKRVTKGFNSKSNCDARTYSYTLPTFTFEADCKTEEDRKKFRISDEKRDQVNEVLSHYNKSKNYHNFTIKKDAEDPSTLRFMYSFQIEDTFVESDLEFAVLKVKGQSFMLHQIRKMVGMALAVIRGQTDISTLERVFGKEPIDVPTAPSLGLVLEKVHYDRYNKRYSTDGIHASLEWDEMDEKVEQFKREHIYPNIIKTEIEQNSMAQWLEESLAKQKFTLRDPMKRSSEKSEKSDEAIDETVASVNESDESPKADEESNNEEIGDLTEKKDG